MSGAPHRVPPDYLTIAEVARKLRLSRKKVKALIEEEGLPAYDLGDRAYRVPAEKFEEWLEGRRITSAKKNKEASLQRR